GGDIKLYAIIGIVLEIHLVFLSLFFAAILGLFGGKLLMKRINPIPFVPFIYAGSILAYLFGPTLLGWYIGFL
ncbi:MAG: prepilin peptidase, partial [Bacillota bacterium]